MRIHRILLTTAGAGNAINVATSLRDGLMGFMKGVYIVGTNINKYELAKSNADKNYLVPPFNQPREYCEAIRKIIEKEKIDFMIPNHEFEIAAIRRYGDERILSKCFLPKKETVELCIDKYKLISYLSKNGLSVYVPNSWSFDAFGLDLNMDESVYPLWLRLKQGAGSRGATLVHNNEELNFWVEYWINNKGVDASDFMASEYLPGKDYHYFSLWKDGEMVIGKAIQRLQYCCSKYTLTGTSSSPSLCKIVLDEELDALSQAIIKMVDSEASGLFGIDYKCNEKGRPCLTEINIGRFPRINYIFNHVGPNMAELYYYCGRGIKFQIRDNVLHEGDDWHLFRDFDLGFKLVNKLDIDMCFEEI